MDSRNIIERKYASLKRKYLWYVLSHKLNLVLVSEFPKSGGTWYCQMLSHYLQLPYPRNTTPGLQRSVLHGHYLYSSRFNKPVCVVRDGRDVMVSAYHHLYFGNSYTPAAVTENFRRKVSFKNFENISDNMPAFIEFMFTKFSLGLKRITWASFIQSYLHKPDVVFVKYEDLLNNTAATLAKSIHDLFGDTIVIDGKKLHETVAAFSFESQSQRKPGEEHKNSFLRKGISGDWQNNFSPEACKTFHHYAGELLIQLGYEINDDWCRK